MIFFFGHNFRSVEKLKRTGKQKSQDGCFLTTFLYGIFLKSIKKISASEFLAQGFLNPKPPNFGACLRLKYIYPTHRTPNFPDFFIFFPSSSRHILSASPPADEAQRFDKSSYEDLVLRAWILGSDRRKFQPNYTWRMGSQLVSVVHNHGDRKSPKWGYGTPYKWPFYGL